ncbi:MAG: YqzL family protein [Bacilli bacterium]|nr:YqzL family protein [Bacilli bacterium]
MNEILWNLFKKTGNIKYYNLLQEIKRSDDNENRENRRNSFNRD